MAVRILDGDFGRLSARPHRRVVPALLANVARKVALLQKLLDTADHHEQELVFRRRAFHSDPIGSVSLAIEMRELSTLVVVSRSSNVIERLRSHVCAVGRYDDLNNKERSSLARACTDLRTVSFALQNMP